MRIIVIKMKKLNRLVENKLFASKKKLINKTEEMILIVQRDEKYKKIGKKYRKNK